MSDHAPHDSSLRGRLREATGLDVARCYQCGKCSAGCPMAEEMAHKPHQTLRLAQLDLGKRIAEDDSIWLCLTCETCTTRCPNEVDPARLIDGLRELVGREYPDAAPRRIRAFHKAFLDAIRAHGRVYELGMIMGYKLRSGRLFDDVFVAPKMVARGKLAFLPRRIEGLEDLQRIYDACLAQEAAHEVEEHKP